MAGLPASQKTLVPDEPPPPPHQLLHRQAQWPVPLPVKRWRHIRDSSSCLRPGTCQTQDSRLAVLDVGAELAVLPAGDDGVRVRVQYNAGLYRSKQSGGGSEGGAGDREVQPDHKASHMTRSLPPGWMLPPSGSPLPWYSPPLIHPPYGTLLSWCPLLPPHPSPYRGGARGERHSAALSPPPPPRREPLVPLVLPRRCPGGPRTLGSLQVCTSVDPHRPPWITLIIVLPIPRSQGDSAPDPPPCLHRLPPLAV